MSRSLEVTPHRRLVYRHLVDFVPDVEPYEINHVLELHASSQSSARLDLTFDAMHNAAWTQRQVSGWESELDKLAAVLNSAATHSGGR